MAGIEITSTVYLMAIVFFLVALVYSSVGMGGGSSYTAIMAILSINVLAIPIISLLLNLIVTSIGSYNFIRNRHARLRLILPFILSSIPMAYLGGALKLPSLYFSWILFISLLFVAARIYLWENITLNLQLSAQQKIIISILSGGLLGLIAGIVGIGGGIYLVPLIIILGLGSEKEAAACGAIFIWLNSVSGLSARIQFNEIYLLDFWPLFFAVITGAVIGSHLAAFKLNARNIDKLLGIVILVAIVSLARRLFVY